jgi:hypothetical protein
MSLIQNEQTKLTATALNNVAVAFVVAGFVAPVIGFARTLEFRPGVESAIFSAVWLLTGSVLHVAARLILRRLQP